MYCIGDVIFDRRGDNQYPEKVPCPRVGRAFPMQVPDHYCSHDWPDGIQQPLVLGVDSDLADIAMMIGTTNVGKFHQHAPMMLMQRPCLQSPPHSPDISLVKFLTSRLQGLARANSDRNLTSRASSTSILIGSPHDHPLDIWRC